jgi:hypothetical protein
LSYYTQVEISFSDEPPDVEAACGVARLWLEEQGIYAVDDILADLRRAWAEGGADFSDLRSEDFDGLMRALSAAHPSLRIYVRGLGEEFADVWLRQYEGGEPVYTLGPFDEVGT